MSRDHLPSKHSGLANGTRTRVVACSGSVLLCLVASLADVRRSVGAPVAPSVGGAPTVNTIFEAWEHRQESVRSLRFEIEEAATTMSGTELVGSGHPVGGWPREDRTNHHELTVVIEGEKIRVERQGLYWSTKLAKFAPLHYTAVFDGMSNSNLYTGAAYTPHAKAFTNTESSFRDRRNFHYGAIVLTYRALSRPLGVVRKDGWSVREGTRPIRDIPCMAIRKEHSDGTYEELWLDPARGFVVLRREQSAQGRRLGQLSIEYELDPQGLAVPTGWQCDVFSFASGRVKRSVKAKVREFEINGAVDASAFRLPYPVGTVIRNETADSMSIVKSDGPVRPITSLEMEQGVDYSSLMTGEYDRQRQRRTTWPWAVGGGLGILVLLFLRARLWRRRGGE